MLKLTLVESSYKSSTNASQRTIHSTRFSTDTLKLSYSCMPNMKSIISSHNKHVLSKTNTPIQQPDTCNCRKKPECPLEGNCLQTNVIYQATVTTETRNHQTSFRHSKRRNGTELSKHVWNLQDSKKPFRIKWRVFKRCKPYSNVNKKCNLSLYEKFIICKKESCSLNGRNELASSCPHRNQFILQKFRVT